MAVNGVSRKASMECTQASATDSPVTVTVMMPSDWVVDTAATDPSVSTASTLHSPATASAAMAWAATLPSAATALVAMATHSSVDWEVLTALAPQVSPVAAQARVPWVVQV